MSQNMVQKQANQRLLKKKYHSRKREFNPDLKPGEEKVTQEGQTGEKQQQRQQQLIH